jgi:translation initiation factor IF-2
MNISTLAKTLGVTISELRDTGTKNGIYGFSGRNTRIPYKSAQDITRIIKPDRLSKLENDDKVYIPASITVSELAEAIGRSSGMVIKNLLMSGVMATLNEKIDYDTASLISQELGVQVFPEEGGMFASDDEAQDLQLIRTIEYEGNAADRTMVARPPVVTVMGHVDHGKTTLLDKIRKTDVASGEAGAITQHISSYQITYKEKKITFIDTPGHEAFTAMRARGSQLADIIILVVSAVEGVKPQTVEVIERAKLSQTAVIVAMNKTDLPGADLEKTMSEVAKFGLTPEEWGGETPFIPISAKTGEHIDRLLDVILLHAEIAELKGEVDCQGQAVVIESNLDRQLGVKSTVLVVKDTIKVGDNIHCAGYSTKIRRLEDTNGVEIKEAELGRPVMLIGLPQVVDIGEPIVVYKNAKEAQLAANQETLLRSQKRVSGSAKAVQSDADTINIVLVADVSGSLEALKESIIKLPQEQVKVAIKREVVGQVSETDVEFAITAEATILAFHTDVSRPAEKILKKSEVKLVKSSIIYELLAWVEEAILSQTKRETRIDILGKAEVLALFKADKPTVQIMGGEVKEGKILMGKQLQVVREGEVIGRVDIQELQKNKAPAKEINISQQFGISVTGRTKVKKGDILESIDEVVIS